jgi:hypothetical protein
MTERITYYVSVGSEQIVTNPEGINYEYEIAATDEELDMLTDLFEKKDDMELDGTKRAKTPYESFEDVDDQDERNDPYDLRLRQIYLLIHQLGVPETKAHIEKMGIL